VRRALILLPLLGLLVAGCTYPLTVSPTGAAQAIRSVVTANTRLTPLGITCPTDVMATVGRQFVCHFLVEGGTEYRAALRITKVRAGKVVFSITTSKS
jgi:Domain of unknown function (DUF4333)